MRPLVFLFVLCSCASMAIRAAAPKKANPVQSAHSKEANDVFWTAFHAGAYDEIPHVREALERAYLEDPFDAITTAHLGFLHIWHISERERQAELQATITDDMILSRQYFAEAVEMTHDPRYVGFLAGTEMAIGAIHKDDKVLRTGYFRMQEAVAQFPEFNLFARGFGLSQFPHDSDRYKAGMEDMWKNVEFCFGAALDRTNPDYTPFMSQQTTVGEKRVCWNGWMAPHNHEGFVLNLGDMLVKQGDVKAARRMYENAKLSSTYDQWPFKDVLEKRIADADKNVEVFRQPNDKQPRGGRMMFASDMSCSGCHADMP